MGVLQKNLILFNNENNYKKLFEKELKGHYKRIIYLKDEIIIKNGIRDEYIYYLENGKVLITKYDNKNNEYSIGYVMQGEFFGFSSYFELPEISSYRALTGCVIYAIDTFFLRKRIQESKEFSKQAAFVVINSIRQQSNRNAMLMLKDAKEVLLNFIYEHIQKYGRVEPDGSISVEFDINMGDISKTLNITRETISRIFSALKKEGLIETKRKYIKIKNVDRFLKEINV